MARYPLPVVLSRFVTTGQAELSTAMLCGFTVEAVDVSCAFKLATHESGAVRVRPPGTRFAVAILGCRRDDRY